MENKRQDTRRTVINQLAKTKYLSIAGAVIIPIALYALRDVDDTPIKLMLIATALIHCGILHMVARWKLSILDDLQVTPDRYWMIASDVCLLAVFASAILPMVPIEGLEHLVFLPTSIAWGLVAVIITAYSKKITLIEITPK